MGTVRFTCPAQLIQDQPWKDVSQLILYPDIFEILGVDGQEYGVYEYIRENSNMNSPVTDLASDDLRCNVGADGSVTDTVDVPPGAEFTFTADVAVYHQGPVCM